MAFDAVLGATGRLAAEGLGFGLAAVLFFLGTAALAVFDFGGLAFFLAETAFFFSATGFFAAFFLLAAIFSAPFSARHCLPAVDAVSPLGPCPERAHVLHWVARESADPILRALDVAQKAAQCHG